MPKLDLTALCEQVSADTFSVFMAVPTIYVKLIDHLATLEDEDVEGICEGFANMRLNVSGSRTTRIDRSAISQGGNSNGPFLLAR